MTRKLSPSMLHVVLLLTADTREHLVTIMARQECSPEDLRAQGLQRRRRSSAGTTATAGARRVSASHPLLPSISEAMSDLGSDILLDAIDSRGKTEIEMILREMAVNPNIRTKEAGRFPLHIAAARGDIELVYLLLDHGAAIEAVDDQGQTALHVAVVEDHCEVVKALLGCDEERDSAVDLGEAGRHRTLANPKALDNNGHTPLSLAAWHGISPATLELLTGLGEEVVNQRCRDPVMPSALFAAAAAGKLETAKILLRQKANPSVSDEEDRTLLHRTHWPIAAKLTPLLLKHGADARAKDGNGLESVHVAARQGKRRIVDELLGAAKPAPVEAPDFRGATPLIYAAESGSVALVRSLIEKHKADVRAVDVHGNDAFLAAATKGHSMVLAYLLGRQARDRGINQPNACGHTALHAAAQFGRTETARFLLTMGADPKLVTREGLSGLKVPLIGQATPANLARAMGHEETARMIERFDESDVDDGRIEWAVECVGPKA